ncbi:MAG TPA: hypothetical protein VGP44_06010, partial [Gemmatimonadales bacterium]|nr:hypothetical protein [Gemmatimonadales bacterium]
LSYDLVRQYAALGPPKIVLGGPRKHQRLVVERRRSYFGFDLETEVEPIEGQIPPELQPAARDVLTQALVEGETVHPDQQRLRRSLAELDELWRRSGGVLRAISPEEVRLRIRQQLEDVTGWEDFLRRRVSLDPRDLVDDETREKLEALPGRLHLRGDAVPLDYEVEGGVGVARVRLREGQAKRLRPDELPPVDRPLRFAVQRGTHPPIQADTIPALQSLLQRPPKADRDESAASYRDRAGRRGRKHGHPGRRGGKPPGRPRR